MSDLPTEAQQALDEFGGRQSEREAAQRLVDALRNETNGSGS
jgi:hypothetical protein